MARMGTALVRGTQYSMYHRHTHKMVWMAMGTAPSPQLFNFQIRQSCMGYRYPTTLSRCPSCAPSYCSSSWPSLFCLVPSYE